MFAKRAGKLPIIVVAAALVVLLAGAGIFVMRSKIGAAKKSEAPKNSLELGEFVVNLADTPQIHYLKTNIVIEVQGHLPTTTGGHGEGSGADPKIRDAVIGVLSAKRMGELVRPNGKELLKKEIAAAVNARMKDGKVTDVYFSEFAMQ